MDFREINNHFKQVNKDISGMNNEIKQQKIEDKQKFNDSTFTLLKLMSEDMRSHNASEQSIQLALQGTYEFYKVITKAKLPQSSINSLLHHENQTQRSTSTFSPGINLSFPRQEIIKALQSSSRTLELKEIAEKTGLNYKTLRMTLSRMHEAGLIAHPFRGRYTTLEQDAASKKRMEEEQKARGFEMEDIIKRFAHGKTVTTDATDANKTDSPKESAH